LNPEVKALAVFDEGAGPALFAAGSFKRAGGIIVNHVARWNGASWSALAGGVLGYLPEMRTLCVHDDGSGPVLYATGDFTTVGGVAVRGIARWDGLGSGSSGLGRGLGCDCPTRTSGPVVVRRWREPVRARLRGGGLGAGAAGRRAAGARAAPPAPSRP
jgi:hypothetical protein